MQMIPKSIHPHTYCSPLAELECLPFDQWYKLSLQAALAAIVVVALKGLYFQLRDIYKFYKLSLHDMVRLTFQSIHALLLLIHGKMNGISRNTTHEILPCTRNGQCFNVN